MMYLASLPQSQDVLADRISRIPVVSTKPIDGGLISKQMRGTTVNNGKLSLVQHFQSDAVHKALGSTMKQRQAELCMPGGKTGSEVTPRSWNLEVLTTVVIFKKDF